IGFSQTNRINNLRKNDDSSVYSEDEYVVEKILDKRYNSKTKKTEYLIKWKGYNNPSDNTWEPEENCVCQFLISSSNIACHYLRRFPSNNVGFFSKKTRE
ncbi:unnamed protein product, partial [Dracunculus medinensis]|uniref:Chromo domain-containing protein n=1 Tax=Dracunculus medinensis TaxID=318479 RepID=A0A0N4UQV7_DRAME